MLPPARSGVSLSHGFREFHHFEKFSSDFDLIPGLYGT
jgi:hypothetical protein